MGKEKEIRSIWKFILLHLFPGIVLSAAYIILLKAGVLPEYPKLVILGLAGVVSFIPVQLGYLFYTAKKEEGSYNIFKILGLKSKMKAKELIIYTVLLFLAAGALITALKPLSNLMLNKVFSWIPNWYKYTNEDISLFSRNIIIVVILVSFFIFTLMGPIIEELYFRGFLLARMKWMGKYSVLLNVTLFAVYHFWTPWLIISRIIMFLPLFYFVYKKDSLKLAILVHCLANFTDVIGFMSLL